MASALLVGRGSASGEGLPSRGAEPHGLRGGVLPAPRFVRMVGGIPVQGSLNDPLGVAASPAEDGRVYVVDSGNARIQVYSSGLHPLGAFGRRGRGPGEFWQPSDVAVSPDGEYLYVVDRGTGYVQRFEPRAECFRPFRVDCFTGSHVLQFAGKSIGDDFFQDPTGIAVDGEGSIFVADRGAHVIKKFAGPEPTFLAKFGGLGFGSGKLSDPTDVAIGPEGKVWVADSGNDRVSIFSNDGKFERNFGGDLSLYHPTGIAVATDGSSLVRFYDPSYSNPEVMRFDPKRRPAWKDPLALGGADTDRAQYFPLQGVALTPDGKALLADQFAPDFSLISLPDAEDPHTVPVASRGREQQQFDSPIDVAALGNIVAVSDRRNRRVQLLDVNRNFAALGLIGGMLSDDVTLQSPRGVAIWAPNGQSSGRPGAVLPKPDAVRVFVADPDLHSVFIFDAKGNFVGRIGDGRPRSSKDGLNKPYDVAVGPDGNIYIADTGNHRIVRRTPEGAEAGPPIGEAGPGPGQLQYPVAISFGPHGWLYVLEAGKMRLQAFTLDGKLASKPWDSPSERVSGDDIPSGELWNPVSLAGDSDQLFVLESSPDDNWVRVQVLRPEVDTPLGRSVTTTFGNHTGPGDGELWQPSGIGLSVDGDIYLADTGNNRLQLFRWSDDLALPSQTPPPTATATPTDTPIPTDEPLPTPTPSPTLPPSASPSPELPTATPSPTATPAILNTATAPPPPSSTATLEPSATASATARPSLPPTETPFRSATATRTNPPPTATPSPEVSPTAIASPSLDPTAYRIYFPRLLQVRKR